MIPLFKVMMQKDAVNNVEAVLKSGYIGEGPMVKQFTKSCTDFVSNPNAVATNSGTAALELALALADVKPGDFVISTPMTCLATNTSILRTGAKILWADVEPTTGCVDFQSVKNLVKENEGKIKAMMVVHWGGYPCDMLELQSLGGPIIEDAAHAWGASICNIPVGAMGDFVCFSFQAIKHLTTGDGGLLTCRRTEDWEKARLMKWFGLDRDLSPDMRCNQDPPVLGFKMHMNDIAAAIGLANFNLAKENISKNIENALFYNSELSHLENVHLPLYARNRKSSYWLYPLLVDNQEAFIAFMQDGGIACSKVHERNDNKTLFKAFKRTLPGVDYFSSHQVNIPVGWWLTEKERDHIVATIKEFDTHGNTGYRKA